MPRLRDSVRRAAAPALLLLISSAGCDEAICDADELRSALAGAAVGDTVAMGACRIELSGSLSVPDGVTLRGEGAQSVLAGGMDAPVIVLRGDTRGATLSDVRVESGGSKPAIYATAGTGKPVVSGVSVSAARGAGIGAQQLDALELRDVDVTGPVRLEDIGLLPAVVQPTESATQGVVFVEVGRGSSVALLERVRLTGFASNAALFVQSRVIWRGGSVGAGRGSGIFVSGGSLEAEDVEVSEVGQSSSSLIPAAGVIATDGAAVAATGLNSTDSYAGSGTANNVLGVLATSATLRLTNSMVARVGSVGVWAQRSPLIDIQGGMFAECSLAGVLGVDTDQVGVDGAAIEMTRLVRLTDATEIGDGIEVRGATTRTRLAALRLAGNARAGIVLDAAGGALDAEISDVVVDGSGTQLGAVAQNGTIPPGWDVGVTRAGAAAANDAALTTTLPIVETTIAPPSVDRSVLTGL